MYQGVARTYINACVANDLSRLCGHGYLVWKAERLPPRGSAGVLMTVPLGYHLASVCQFGN